MKNCFLAAIALGLAYPAPLLARHDVAQIPTKNERIIVIEGGRNFRDAGGYLTIDGRTVRWRTLYRSGSLGGLTPEGRIHLQKLDIRAIIDLRMTTERNQDQNNWLSVSGLGYWTRDYHLGGDEASLAQIFSDPANLNADKVRTMMINGYRTMTKELAPQYRELFARLAGAGKGAVVVNCTAGKDRTGIGTALVLTALGVPYETVREDYLLSNAKLDANSLKVAISPHLAALPHDVVMPLLSVEGAYLDAAFDQMKQDHGSVEAYLERELGVGPDQIALLKRRMID